MEVSIREAFQIFNLKPGATREEVKKAHRSMLMKWHPDRNNGSKESNEMTIKINISYQKIETFLANSVKGFFDKTQHKSTVNSSNDDFYWINQKGERKHIKDMETTHLVSLVKFMELNKRTNQKIYTNIKIELSNRTVKTNGSKMTIKF